MGTRTSDFADGGDFEDTDLAVVVETPGVGPVKKLLSRLKKFVGIAPRRSFSADTSLALTDVGGVLVHPSADTTGRTVTIPSNASVPFPVNTTIAIRNQNGAGALTIVITADTLRQAGTGATGSRTVAANGWVTLYKEENTEWVISGVGLT